MLTINKLYLVAVIIYYILSSVDTILILVLCNIWYWCGVIFYIGEAKYFEITELKRIHHNFNIIAQVNYKYGIVLTMINVIIIPAILSRNQCCNMPKNVHKFPAAAEIIGAACRSNINYWCGNMPQPCLRPWFVLLDCLNTSFVKLCSVE